MRLFTTIHIDENMKDSICNIIKYLKQVGAKVSFTLRENQHITLNFIGETSRLQGIKYEMDQVHAASISLTLHGRNTFTMEGGDILWMG